MIGKKKTEVTHIYNITLAASSLAQPGRRCHTLGCLPLKSQDCLLEAEGNQGRQTAEIYGSRHTLVVHWRMVR